MACILITYDLNREGSGYSAKNKIVTDEIKRLYPTYWHHIESVYLVSTQQSPLEVATAIQPVLDENDKLFTTRVSDDAAWTGINEKGEAWLNKNI